MEQTKQLLLWICLCMVLISTASMAQAAFSSGSQHASTNDLYHTYIIGEMALVHTVRTSSLIVTQGTLQPTNQTLSVEEPGELWTNAINIYPNPVREQLYIDTYFNSGEAFSFYLMDLKGRLLYSSKKKISSSAEQHSLDMSGYQTGTYLLFTEIQNNGKQQKQRFNIVKY